MNDINERLDSLKSTIQKPEFLEGKGLSNEVNIYIFCYKPEDEMKVRHFTDKLTVDQTLECRVIECNLYKMFLEICDGKHITKSIPNMEINKGKEFLLGQLKGIAGSKTFISKMQNNQFNTGDVLLITGVGEVFPFIRVHSLLEAMQPYFSETPILVLYPGVYNGYSMKLFDKLKPNSYYRAFNIL